MVGLRRRTKFALDEARTLILVVQVMLGFEFEGVFARGFDALSRQARLLHLLSLGLALITLALLLLPAARHQIVERGRDDEALIAFTSRVMLLALMPFAVGLGIGVDIVAERIVPGLGAEAGIAATLAAAWLWYGLPWRARRRA